VVPRFVQSRYTAKIITCRSFGVSSASSDAEAGRYTRPIMPTTATSTSSAGKLRRYRMPIIKTARPPMLSTVARRAPSLSARAVPARTPATPPKP
jgi:hypothetical protein